MLANLDLYSSSRAAVYTLRPMEAELLAKKRATLDASLMLIAPGIVPVLALPEEPQPGSEPINRMQPMESLERVENKKCVLAACRDLIRLRRNAGGNTRGLSGGHVDIYHVDQPARFVGVHQWQAGGAGDSVIILVNHAMQAKTDYRVGLPAPGIWHVRFSSDWVGYDPAFETTGGGVIMAEPVASGRMPYSGLFCIPASTLLILSQ